MRIILLLALILGFHTAFSQLNYTSYSVGSGATQIEMEITVNAGAGTVDFVYTGPANRWFAIAFAGSSMSSASYSIIANVNGGNPAEYTLSGQSTPSIQSTQNLSSFSSTTNGSRKTYTFSRSINTGDASDYTFPSSPGSVSVIWAYGSGTSLAYHANRGMGSMSFANPCNIPVTTLSAMQICSSDSALIFGQYEHVSGTYYDTLQTAIGCDSILSQELIVSTSISNNLPDTATCFGDSLMIFGSYVTTGGTYIDTLNSASGCDSIVSINVAFHQVDTMVFNNGSTLVANQFATGFQWYDCATNMPIAGATSQSFTPQQTGTYKVEITVLSCTKMSSCHPVIVDDIAESSKGELKIYPQPAQDFVIVESKDSRDYYLYIYNLQGSLLQGIQMTGGKEQVDVSGLSQGVYIIRVESEDSKTFYQQKLIKY